MRLSRRGLRRCLLLLLLRLGLCLLLGLRLRLLLLCLLLRRRFGLSRVCLLLLRGGRLLARHLLSRFVRVHAEFTLSFGEFARPLRERLKFF
ncbi:MAG: hypothetical protein FJ278_13640, partial [Planctomycetes bacterium]|nr:hypothetical protein [Planctomycetota bacterium]